MPRKIPVAKRTPYYGDADMVLRKPNPVEAAFRQLAESEGWDVTKRGWPDFLCRRNGELMAVEVKGPHDGLSGQQYETISDLRRAGIPTYVWSQDTGYTEVGPSVGESVFSLKQTIAELRQIIERLQGSATPQQDEPEIIAWAFVEDDPSTIAWIAQECHRTHRGHELRTTIGRSGSWCSDLVVLARRYSPAEILAMTGMENIGKLKQRLHLLRTQMFHRQHDQMHTGLPRAQRCTACEFRRVA